MDERRLEEIAQYYDAHDTSEAMEAAEWSPVPPSDGEQMASYSVRLPAAVLNSARELAAERGIKTGAYLRELIEAGIARATSSEVAVPLDVLLAAAEEYRHRRAG